MRGIEEKPTQLFSYVDLERRIPLDHPLRAIRALIDKVLAGQSRTFTKLYARDGRPGIPPSGFCTLCFSRLSIACAPNGC
jgi:hypothetical protein